MINNIIRYSVRNKLIISLLTIALAAWGTYSLTQLSIDAVPDITNNQVRVITTSPNLATQEVEQFITFPVELAMANLPGVVEMRSVSKLGLSIVTIVFEEDMGTYLPRQLVSEQLKKAEKEIPAEMGTPEMAPITTGLGEIYQYILDVEPKYADHYDAMELRSIQDWIVRRQLSGIQGVVEINSWGGYLKQYEVAVNPEKLRSMNITLTEVYDALEANNENTGGSYIEKGSETYFIRGQGQVQTLDDIRETVIKTENNIPVIIGDVAEVGYGHAVRYGAITANGEGEKVGGQLLMLKGENTNEVIDRIKERIAQVQESLPEGVVITPFLDRTELISETTATVSENLILGGLIVIFVLVLLIGNFRSGLIVASVIPLSMLFALGMMNLFGVSANLMSLGAIDFGIIIDGAVIIVEFTLYQLTTKSGMLSKLTGAERAAKVDELTIQSSSRMMRSAIFGQVIILIVFIPILSLTGIEGKMFTPMALTFGFAMLGAMILCLTYVPMISSVLLKGDIKEKNGVSAKIMNFFNGIYEPTIRFALRRKSLVLGVAGALFISALIVFLRMGGEFIPQLDEGDFAIHPLVKPGTSLSQTIETNTRLEGILVNEFPDEVKQVVSRIGTGEVPNDPMSMEMSDIIIILHDKDQWTKVETKEELAEKMQEAMIVVPGVNFAFSQPIEMRFNELMTGVRSDVAIKIYGDDLDVLFEQGNEAAGIVGGIRGAADINVEQITGLPQMVVEYERNKIAQYGLAIEDVNQAIQTAFSGGKAGVVFEGERRFDLVVRLQEPYRQDIENLRDLYISLPNGNQVPLEQVATIGYREGPAQISRDDSRRRIVVGVNVRDRDVESLVNEIRLELENNLDLPAGYYITYGGAFENLQRAKDRLSIAVPIALGLIFLLLYFTFSSFKETLMVFTAIPLAAIGGVFALWIRGIPFSISAGVGFIALFGIAVLNGIILISFFKQLKEDGMKDIDERILQGTRQRLRPVLLTAFTDALGFLPMALSTSAGAEVQRPLATVVIGGLISATLLTLVVLPVLYRIFDEGVSWRMNSPKIAAPIVLFFGLMLGAHSNVFAQSVQEVTLDEAIESALQNNLNLKAAFERVRSQQTLSKSRIDIGDTELFYSRSEYDAEQGVGVESFGISQELPFPTEFINQKQVGNAEVDLQQAGLNLTKAELIKRVRKAYYQTAYGHQQLHILNELSEVYQQFMEAAELRYETGESGRLELTGAKSRYQNIQTEQMKAKAQLKQYYFELRRWTYAGDSAQIEQSSLEQLAQNFLNGMNDVRFDDNPKLSYLREQSNVAEAELGLQRSQWLPNLNLQYKRQEVAGTDGFYGIHIGLKVPLWFTAQHQRSKAARLESKAVSMEVEDYRFELQSRTKQLRSELVQLQEQVKFYQNEQNALAEELINTAQKSFEAGEINYLTYTNYLDEAIDIKQKYQQVLLEYLQQVAEWQYLNGQ
ncbi:CusA/CzcA family heavy metal efflux RND transporter [Gracilimonas mengyeensis]|uniref:Cobalt-zinc-cadmium resistance protein CzcA n=1 Tax=Gracilimonas mengyeensis TaxID=1302730 RepID=A0A521D1M3_9BACT|nr:CusA/CzcA family heavy metal efflux RND transporter [Gracilimonas mengyeensis]SMO65599.1 cobalt-zinc-cadmium resistance protein CzcA [Gracilimonas mengyeensis]